MFPRELPEDSIFYLAWYAATWLLHVVAMNYVLAGSALVAAAAVCERSNRSSAAWRRLGDRLRDWLPFALGVTITFGVAPLLFVQVLYRREFYTANLLLSHRWMSIVPVLIVAFYLLYLQKGAWWSRRSAGPRAVVAIGVFVCFAFVAGSWTENHLLSLQGQAVWTAEYVADRWFYSHPELWPRLALWCCGSVPMLSMLAAIQIRCDPHDARSTDEADAREDVDRETTALLGRAAVVASSAAAVAALVYLSRIPDVVRARIVGGDATPYAVAAVGGFIVQAGLWFGVARRGDLSRGRLTAIGATLGLALVAATALREIRRTSVLDWSAQAQAHAAAAQVGGFAVFVTFFVVNALAVAWCVRLVRRHLRPD